MAVNVDFSAVYDARNCIPVEMAHICVDRDRCAHAHRSCFVFAVSRLVRSLVSQRENQTLHVCHSWSAVFLAAALTHIHSSRCCVPSPFTEILMDLKTDVLSVSLKIPVVFFQHIIRFYICLYCVFPNSFVFFQNFVFSGIYSSTICQFS